MTEGGRVARVARGSMAEGASSVKYVLRLRCGPLRMNGDVGGG